METLCNSKQSLVNTYIRGIKDSLERLNPDRVERIVDVIWSAFIDNKQVFIMGNGGSASTASHFACDLGKGTVVEGMKRLRVICLNDNMAMITAFSNDIDYAEVFKEQLINLMNPDDVVIAITVSGNSPNILRAVEYARKNDAVSIGFIGFSGGKLSPLVDEKIVINSSNYGCVEDIHLILAHMISQSFKYRLTG